MEDGTDAQPGGVAEQLTNRDVARPVVVERSQVGRSAVVEREAALLLQDQRRGADDRLRVRRHPEQRVRLHRELVGLVPPADRLVENDDAAPRHHQHRALQLVPSDGVPVELHRLLQNRGVHPDRGGRTVCERRGMLRQYGRHTERQRPDDHGDGCEMTQRQLHGVLPVGDCSRRGRRDISRYRRFNSG